MAVFGAGAAAGFTGTALHAGTAAAATTSTALTGAAVAGYAASALSVMSLIRQGQAAKVNADVQADRLRADARASEVNRRRKLVQSLASQNATRAASGIAFFEGSSKNIALEDIRQGEGSFLSTRAGAETAAQSIEAAGGYSATTSYINAGATLLDQYDRGARRGDF